LLFGRMIAVIFMMLLIKPTALQVRMAAQLGAATVVYQVQQANLMSGTLGQI